jgi:hypothetical protein
VFGVDVEQVAGGDVQPGAVSGAGSGDVQRFLVISEVTRA